MDIIILSSVIFYLISYKDLYFYNLMSYEYVLNY